MSRCASSGSSHTAARPSPSATRTSPSTRRRRRGAPHAAASRTIATAVGVWAGWSSVTAATRPAAPSGGRSAPSAQRSEAEGQQRQRAPAEPRSDEPPAQALLHAAPAARRERERHDRAGQREPRVARQPAEQHVGGRARKHPREPEERLVHGRGGERAARRVMEQGAEPREARRVVLQLGVAGPPSRIEAPRREPDRDRVDQAVELARMVVEDEQAAAERPPPEGDGVGGQQRGRQPGAGHGWR